MKDYRKLLLNTERKNKLKAIFIEYWKSINNSNKNKNSVQDSIEIC